MKATIHRSENLVILRSEDSDRLELEIRFPSSFARGWCEGRCPRCGAPGRPGHWELEGPDGRGNTVYFSCNVEGQCQGSDGVSFNWTQEVQFPDGWTDK
jgi:hypothetical protein